jgi:hypothetical protein
MSVWVRSLGRGSSTLLIPLASSAIQLFGRVAHVGLRTSLKHPCRNVPLDFNWHWSARLFNDDRGRFNDFRRQLCNCLAHFKFAHTGSSHMPTVILAIPESVTSSFTRARKSMIYTVMDFVLFDMSVLIAEEFAILYEIVLLIAVPCLTAFADLLMCYVDCCLL